MKLKQPLGFEWANWQAIRAVAGAVLRACGTDERLGGRGEVGIFRGMEVLLLSEVVRLRRGNGTIVWDGEGGGGEEER